MLGNAVSELFITLLVIAPFALVFVWLWRLRLRQENRRDAAFASFAKRFGLEYALEDRFGMLDRSFRVFAVNDPRVVRNVVSGTWKGMPLLAADYRYEVGKSRTELSLILFQLPIKGRPG